MSDNTWYSVDLGNGVTAFDSSNKIQDAFFAAYTAAGGKTNGMAAFSRHDLETNVVTYYFTPASSFIAKLFNAVPCEKPSTENLSLLIGDEIEAWEGHFPGRASARKRK